MLIQWCLKGIPEQRSFGDAEAKAVVDSAGINSTWLRSRISEPQADLSEDAQGMLSQVALDQHVNGFLPGALTPYISLTAGSTEIDPTSRSAVRFPAASTALAFATRQGTTAGYVFRLWTLVSPKPAPELPGFAEEVRDLNLFNQFSPWHTEGEIAAKLFIPARQIESVTKYEKDLSETWQAPYKNPAVFVAPERISTIVEEV